MPQLEFYDDLETHEMLDLDSFTELDNMDIGTPTSTVDWEEYTESLPSLAKLQCWLRPNRGSLPGSAPLQGAIEESIEDIDTLLLHTFEREKRDHPDIARARGDHHLTTANRLALIIDIVRLSEAALQDVVECAEDAVMSFDTINLAVVTLRRFLGSLKQEPLSREELFLLPAACLSTAYKVSCLLLELRRGITNMTMATLEVCFT